MKKSTLALSVAAALGGFGFATSAFAISDAAVLAPVATAALAGSSYTVAVPAATVLERNPDGIGHQLIIPYFTAQGTNATLIEITNHDVKRGKLVKVRFRGAANSDDLYDFTLALSPGDVWTAAVSKDATGVAKLVSTDASCVLPAAAKNGLFSTNRVDPTPPTGVVVNSQTLEGYVEIITMGDIPKSYTGAADAGQSGTEAAYDARTTAQKAATLFGTIKHASDVATCDVTVLDTKLGTDDTTANMIAKGLTPPTGMISADWIIINQTNTSAWSGAATALQAKDVAGAAGVNGTSSLVFWPQKFGTPTAAGTARDAVGVATGTYSADPLLLAGPAGAAPSTGTAAIVTPQYYDLPDLSTSVVAGELSGVRATATTAALSVKTLAHQVVTASGIAAATEVVFAQPTRRYHVAVNYKAAVATNNANLTTGVLAAAVYQPFAPAATDAYATAGTGFGSGTMAREVCVTNVNAPGVVTYRVAPATAVDNIAAGLFNREETTPGVSGTPFVISPNVPGSPTVLALCGETSVVSINQGGITNPSTALTASLARTDVTFAAGYDASWATWDLTSANVRTLGLPVIANAFIRAVNGTVNYGFAWPAKVVR